MGSSDVLRTVPKQARSARRIDDVLDAAAELFVAEGIDAVSTNAIAAAAGMSIGSLYRNFPSKESIADALTARHVAALDELWHEVLVDDLDLELPALLDRILAPLLDYWNANPVVAPLLRLGSTTRDRQVASLYDSLVARVELVVAAWVPGIPRAELNVAAQTAVAVARALLLEVDAPSGAARRRFVAELRYVLTAYFAAKYPGPDDPRLGDPDAVPPAVRPARS